MDSLAVSLVAWKDLRIDGSIQVPWESGVGDLCEEGEGDGSLDAGLDRRMKEMPLGSSCCGLALAMPLEVLSVESDWVDRWAVFTGR